VSRCEECGQERPVTDGDVLASRMDCYRAAYEMLKDLTKGNPPEWQVLRTARFLAADEPSMADSLIDTEVIDDE
jgi:hypothetical protein